jgi:hypothetical protein
MFALDPAKPRLAWHRGLDERAGLSRRTLQRIAAQPSSA